MTIMLDLSSIDKHFTELNECIYRLTFFRQTVHCLVDDDNDDEVLHAAAAVVKAFVYTPMYIIHI